MNSIALQMELYKLLTCSNFRERL